LLSNQEKKIMKSTANLRDLGQSLWLDNITRNLLQGGLLRRYIDELSVTGLTSNPTIFDHAIKNSSEYDVAIREKLEEGKSGEELFFELALEDLTRAADLFRPIYEQTCGVDGWVSLEVSPLLAHDTKTTLAEAKELHARGKRPNLFIKIAGTQGGLPAIEEAEIRNTKNDDIPSIGRFTAGLESTRSPSPEDAGIAPPKPQRTKRIEVIMQLLPNGENIYSGDPGFRALLVRRL
jgi:hypothetical protein